MMRASCRSTLLPGCTKTIVSIGLCGILAACVSPSHKQDDIWTKGATALPGMPVQQLRQCAGLPYAATRNQSGYVLKYGYAETGKDGRYRICLLSVHTNEKVVTSFDKLVQAPGFSDDGTKACAYIVDQCVADGSLSSQSLLSPQRINSASDIARITESSPAAAPPANDIQLERVPGCF